MTLIITVLKWCGANWKLLAVAALVAGIFYVGDRNGSGRVQGKWDKAEAVRTAAQLAKNQADNTRLNQLEGTKNENLDYVANLYFGLGKSERLRLSSAACGGSGKTGANSASGEGVFPVGISGVEGRTVEDAINEFDIRYRNAALRADKIVEDCRPLNDFNK